MKCAVVKLIAGVDEVGVGPLAGPVVAAAVILKRCCRIAGLADSKVLSARQRESLADEIKQKAIAWAIAAADVDEIDRLNIFHARLLAMKRALEALTPQPTLALIDGTHAPAVACATRTIVKGDASVAAISAASIIAKVARDAQMAAFDAEYPGYEFAQHKGYSTRAHLAALTRLGACKLHRRSFAPVRAALMGMSVPPALAAVHDAALADDDDLAFELA